MRKQTSPRKNIARALLVAVGSCFASMVSAQSPANADNMYNGYLNAYLINVDSTHAYLTAGLTDRSEDFNWHEAYDITGVEDAYDRTKDPARQATVIHLLDRYIQTNFNGHNSTDLAWDGYNDDAAWCCIALLRGYMITGNTSYLTYAKNVWNMGYNRGYDTVLGGGIWENTDKPSKCTLSTASFIPTGVLLYQATGDSSYLTKVEALYAWNRANLLDTSDYHVNESVTSGGTVNVDMHTYNSGLMVEAAAYLYRVTGTSSYYNDAVAMANYQVNRYSIVTPDYVANGPFGSDQFFRALAKFARWNGLWSNYSTWFSNNDSAAWNERRTDLNITHNDLSSPTPTSGELLALETLSPMVYRQVTQIQDIAVPFNFSGRYEFLNVASNMALAVSGTNQAVVQQPYTGSTSQLWTLTATSGGYYQIKNVATGLAVNVSGSFTQAFQQGAKAIQYTAQTIGREDNDEWMPVQNSDGTYTFFNLNSEQVLDNYGASTTSGNQFDQWFANGSTAQKFTLTSR